jgi:aryl-alcohol dehydrogenase-like predicted oxidoreductase
LGEQNAAGWSVIVKEALANGRLTDRGGGEHLAILEQEAVARGTTLDALALGAAISQPWADIVLSGAVTLGQLESNVTAVAIAQEPAGWPDISEAATEYWSRRSALTWQ